MLLPTAMNETTTAPIVQISQLVKSYEHHGTVLKGIDLSVQPGDLISIIGPSGCGKSTLLRCLNALEILDSGSVSVAGTTLTRAHKDARPDAHFNAIAHELRTEVGMLFQALNLFPHRTILDNVMLAPVVVKGVPREEAAANAERLLDKVGLLAFKDRYPYKLSGGQQQRAAIARALAMNPKVMLYDEPTSALDPALVDEVLQVMRGLDEEGMTQIVVTHEMRFARNASDYIVYMEHGEIIEIAPGDTLFTAPKDERTRRFLKPFVDGL